MRQGDLYCTMTVMFFDKCSIKGASALGVSFDFVFSESCDAIYTCGMWEATQSGFTAFLFLFMFKKRWSLVSFSSLVYTWILM